MNRVITGLVAVFASFAFLHQGRTDGNGGHYNHSTGEYHYHHGYSAHDHYDINGDGVVDCPYSFKDNASTKGNTSEYKSFSERSDAKHGVTNNTAESSDKKKPKISSEAFDNIAVVVLVVVILADLIVNHINYKHRK